MKIFFVVPDYYEKRPKKCMNGWGNIFLTVAPDGTALPCHTARMLPGLDFPNVREQSLRSIWYDSAGFNRFRGTGWMKAPCNTCPERDNDLGGCRCQAYMVANDPAAADPVCEFSPHHDRIVEAVTAAQGEAVRAPPTVQPLVFRSPESSRRLARPF